MKTFWKITFLIWALTFCQEGESEKTTPSLATSHLSLDQKTTHSCEGLSTSFDPSQT